MTKIKPYINSTFLYTFSSLSKKRINKQTKARKKKNIMELKISIFVVLLQSTIILQSSSAHPNRSELDPFIVSSCQTTRYPSLCVHTLSAYATKIRHNNDQDLAQTALIISLTRAKSVAIFVAKLTKEYVFFF